VRPRGKSFGRPADRTESYSAVLGPIEPDVPQVAWLPHPRASSQTGTTMPRLASRSRAARTAELLAMPGDPRTQSSTGRGVVGAVLGVDVTVTVSWRTEAPGQRRRARAAAPGEPAEGPGLRAVVAVPGEVAGAPGIRAARRRIGHPSSAWSPAAVTRLKSHASVAGGMLPPTPFFLLSFSRLRRRRLLTHLEPPAFCLPATEPLDLELELAGLVHRRNRGAGFYAVVVAPALDAASVS
jgi:hypothetical protein